MEERPLKELLRGRILRSQSEQAALVRVFMFLQEMKRTLFRSCSEATLCPSSSAKGYVDSILTREGPKPKLDYLNSMSIYKSIS